MAATKYAVYDPATGNNDMYDTLDDAVQAFWTKMIIFSRLYFHNTAYMVVEVNDDGSEVWYNDQNQEIDKPKTPEEIKQMKAAALAAMPGVTTLPGDPNA